MSIGSMRLGVRRIVERNGILRTLNRILKLGGNKAGFHEGDERQQFLRKVFSVQGFNDIPGDYAEFGCCGGATFGMAYKEITRTGGGRKMWAFDSFMGLPPEEIPEDEHPQWVEGAFAMGIEEFKAAVSRRGVLATAYEIVPGYYSDTIDSSSYAGPLPSDIAVAYVDCDLYSSTVSVLSFIANKIKHGTILAFDDYFCYSASRISGERRAFLEFQNSVPHLSFQPYTSFGWHGMSFIVEDASQVAAARDGSSSASN
ncbi:MAG: TylF/MycF family methyltransferase [Parvibaculum sp.]|nr:TylF/MycF family methyltransferase [Parvibaculum sp.]